jgi:hypothetical protein
MTHELLCWKQCKIYTRKPSEEKYEESKISNTTRGSLIYEKCEANRTLLNAVWQKVYYFITECFRFSNYPLRRD